MISKTRVNVAGERLGAFWFEGFDAIAEGVDPVEEYGIVDEWRREHAYPMALCVPSMRNWVGGVTSLGIPPAQRLKRMPRILTKLRRHPGMKLARMQDIGGVRAVLGGPLEVEAVAAKVRRYWDVVRESDYRDEARPDTGYRALHLMVAKRDRTVEIQLRTHREHLWAEEIERIDNRLRLALKDGQGPLVLVEYFRRASDVLWMQERGLRPDSTFVDAFAMLREKVRPYFQSNPGG